jgi:hypothetical protein
MVGGRSLQCQTPRGILIATPGVWHNWHSGHRNDERHPGQHSRVAFAALSWAAHAAATSSRPGGCAAGKVGECPGNCEGDKLTGLGVLAGDNPRKLQQTRPDGCEALNRVGAGQDCCGGTPPDLPYVIVRRCHFRHRDRCGCRNRCDLRDRFALGTNPHTGAPARIDALKTALSVVAGVGGAVALVVAYRRQRDLEQGRFVERFGAAAAQLGDPMSPSASPGRTRWLVAA